MLRGPMAAPEVGSRGLQWSPKKEVWKMRSPSPGCRWTPRASREWKQLTAVGRPSRKSPWSATRSDDSQSRAASERPMSDGEVRKRVVRIRRSKRPAQLQSKKAMEGEKQGTTNQRRGRSSPVDPMHETISKGFRGTSSTRGTMYRAEMVRWVGRYGWECNACMVGNCQSSIHLEATESIRCPSPARSSKFPGGAAQGSALILRGNDGAILTFPRVSDTCVTWETENASEDVGGNWQSPRGCFGERRPWREMRLPGENVFNALASVL